MSLWTPGGEHEVPRDRPSGQPNPPPAGGATSGPASEAPRGPSGHPPGGDDPFAGLSAEERVEAEAMVAEMAEARERLTQVPAAVVVANHAMGLYELAAIHLSSQPPALDEAKLAIDAFGALVVVLEGKLGPDETTLRDALAQIRMAFVQLRGGAGGGPGGEPAGPGAGGPGAGGPEAGG